MLLQSLIVFLDFVKFLSFSGISILIFVNYLFYIILTPTQSGMLIFWCLH